MSLRALLLAAALLAGCGQAHIESTAQAAGSDAFNLPLSPNRIIVIADRGRDERFALERAEQVAIALRHFTSDTSWVLADTVSNAQVERADAVVYLGLDPSRLIPANAIAALHHARRLIVSRSHLQQIHDEGIAFAHVTSSGVIHAGASTIHYGGAELPHAAGDYLAVAAAAPASVLAPTSDPAMPFAVREGNATFINGAIRFSDADFNEDSEASMVAVSDIFNDALGAAPLPKGHAAMLRLEDVSVQVPATRMAAIVEYLAKARVSYGIGLIPAQLIKGETLTTLPEEPQLVNTLRFAQAHGARIILHGLHHSFNSAEDFEFWDAVHNRPLPQDSPQWMRARLSEGLHIEEGLDLHPRFWESPHYSASPTDYRVVGEFFKVAWERRRPVTWVPWVLWSDQYGERILPENLGYISVDGQHTLARQLLRAKEMLPCRGCVVAGFLHPSTVSLEDVQGYVEGLRALGYTFVDPGGFVPGDDDPQH